MHNNNSKVTADPTKPSIRLPELVQCHLRLFLSDDGYNLVDSGKTCDVLGRQGGAVASTNLEDATTSLYHQHRIPSLQVVNTSVGVASPTHYSPALTRQKKGTCAVSRVYPPSFLAVATTPAPPAPYSTAAELYNLVLLVRGHPEVV
jgi:hypothetical protein